MKDVTILTNNGVNVQQSLELFGDMEMYDETLNDFLDMHQEKLTNLEKFRVAGDMPNYAIEVHALKSDARYLGFLTLGDMAYESEMKSKANDSAFVNENHPKILAEAKRVINLAEQYLGRALTTAFPGLVEGSAPVAAPVPPAPAAVPVQPQPQVVTPVAPVGAPVMPAQAAQTQVVGTPVQPVGTPVQPVAPVMSAQAAAPVMPVGAPVQPVQPQPIVQTSESGTIQFFPSNNNIMDQGLSNISTPQQQSVPAVKQGIILIIDDSNLVANFVKKIFSDKYDVLVASDGAQGIQMANDPNIRPKIKTCLVDLYMPNVDGFAVLDNFRQNGIFVKTPVAVISGAEDAPSIERARSYPIIDVLAKPFTDRDVKMVVEKCLAVYF